MTFKLSIVIPAFNASKTIRKTVRSLVFKTNFEVIIVDDGSTDETRAIITDIQKENTNVKYIYQKNQGVSAARNKGLKASSGEFIFFIDSDDYLDNPEQIDILLKDYSYADLIVFGYYLDNGKKKIKVNFKENKQYTNPSEFNIFLKEKFVNIEYRSAVWNKIYRRDIIETEGIRFVSYNEVWSEDFLFNLQYIFSKKCHKIQIIDKNIIVHEDVPNSLSNSKNQKNVDNRIINSLKGLSIILNNEKNRYIWLYQFYFVNFILKFAIASIVINKSTYKEFRNSLIKILTKSDGVLVENEKNIKESWGFLFPTKKGKYHLILLFLASKKHKNILSIILWIRYKYTYKCLK